MTHRTKAKFLIVLCCVLLLTMHRATALAQATSTSIGVFYIGPEDVVAEAINLAHPYIVRVDQPELAQVIVINNASISVEGLQFYGDQVRSTRIGLVIFCGSMFPEGLTDLGALMGISAFGLTNVQNPAKIVVDDRSDGLQRLITWSSAPDIYARTVISNPNILLPLITTETGQPIVQRVRGREPGQTLIVGGWLGDPANAGWADWPYYHYLVYRLIADAAGRSRILDYAEYPISAVPQRGARYAIAGTGIGVIFGTALVFYFARRLRFMRTGHWAYQTGRKKADGEHSTVDWNSVGFHRTLAGMFILMPLNILLFFLLIRYRLYTLPEVLAPNSLAFSSWQLVEHWAELLWVLLDAGTGIAVVRYFAAHYDLHPHRAFSYFQYYGWWQLLIGAVQLGMVAILTAIVIPGTSFAHLSYFILLQSIIRFPGFLTVFVLLFRATQRLDYEQYLYFFLTYGSAAFQALAYVIFKAWETSLPAMRQDQIAILGLGVGLYAAEWVVFFLGMFLYRRQGYKLVALFLPVSETQVGRQLLSFGIRAALGSLAVPLGAIIQLRLLDSLLSRQAHLWRSWVIAVQIASIFDLLLQQFYRNMMPALSEAIALNYKTLMRYYLTQGVRYGMWLSVFVFVTFAALGQQVADMIFTGVFQQVAEVLLLLLAVGIFRWALWLVDALLLAAERPGLSSFLIIVEQGLCVGGGLFLAPRWGISGFLSAYAIALFIRTLLSWVLMQRMIIRVHIYLWQSLISPLISGVLIYYLVHVILDIVPPIWQAGLVISALLAGLWIYGFLTALFGGWDDAGIQELGRAVQLSGLGKPYAWMLWQCIRLGARISPLHGRFPIVIADIAEEQALAITFSRPTA